MAEKRPPEINFAAAIVSLPVFVQRIKSSVLWLSSPAYTPDRQIPIKNIASVIEAEIFARIEYKP